MWTRGRLILVSSQRLVDGSLVQITEGRMPADHWIVHGCHQEPCRSLATSNGGVQHSQPYMRQWTASWRCYRARFAQCRKCRRLLRYPTISWTAAEHSRKCRRLLRYPTINWTATEHSAQLCYSYYDSERWQLLQSIARHCYRAWLYRLTMSTYCLVALKNACAQHT